MLQSLVNQTPANWGALLYQWMVFMTTNGAVVLQSGTGTSGTFSLAANLITGNTNAVGGIAHANAWWCIRLGTRRHLCFQINGAGTTSAWRVKYSATVAGFTGGSPSATRVPTATDEVVICGSGTDASPVFQDLFPFGEEGLHRANYLMDDVTFGFVNYIYPAGGGTPKSIQMLDIVLKPDPSDQDPAVLYLYSNSNILNMLSSAGAFTSEAINSDDPAQGSCCWFNYNAAGTFHRVAAQWQACGGGPAIRFPGGVGSNVHSAKDNLVPMTWSRGTGVAGPGGYKGISSWLALNGTTHNTGDTLSLTVGSKDFITMKDVVGIWNGSTPLV